MKATLPPGAGAPPRHSAARLDAWVCPLLVPREPLAAALPRTDHLRLASPAAQREHPVVIELWQVSDGRVEAVGMDVHQWSQLAGTALGATAGATSGGALGGAFGGVVGAASGALLGLTRGPSGSLLGAMAGATAGIATGAKLGATGAAAYGATLAGALGRRMSEGSSRVFGTYGEAMVTTPCILTTAEGPLPVSFVLTMHTDSRWSQWGESALGFGFGKRRARILMGDHRRALQTADGASLLELQVSEPVPAPAASTKLPLCADLPFAGWPLLGQRNGQLVLSRLERHLEEPRVRVQAVAAELALAEGFCPGVPAGRHELPRRSVGHPRGAIVVRDLPVHLSYPQPVRFDE